MMKINTQKEFIYNLIGKEKYVAQKRNLKQALNHGPIIKQFHGVIKFN